MVIFYFIKLNYLEKFTNRINNNLINMDLDTYNKILQILRDLEQKKINSDINIVGNISGPTITDLYNKYDSLVDQLDSKSDNNHSHDHSHAGLNHSHDDYMLCPIGSSGRRAVGCTFGR